MSNYRVELPCPIDELKAAAVTEVIQSNQAYMSFVDPCPKPWLSTDLLGRYFLGRCFAFAEALRRVIGGEPVVMQPAGYVGPRAGRGSIHACVLLADGRLADVWGVRPPERVARTMGIDGWVLTPGVFAREMAEAVRARGRDEVEREVEEARAVVLGQWLPGIGAPCLEPHRSHQASVSLLGARLGSL